MKNWQVLTPGEAITHWAMSASTDIHYPGHCRPMPDTVDYQFVSGWVDTGDLPCRTALRAELPTRQIACPAGPFDELAIAFDSAELDFSRFCHRPTLVSRGFKCLVRGKSDPVGFRISTCGGVRIWLEQKEVVRFEPFTRNRPASKEVSFVLSGEPQELILRLEDLHERDTLCFFSMELLSGDEIYTSLLNEDAIQPESEVKQVLSSLRTDRVFYTTGQHIQLVADQVPKFRLPIRISKPAPFPRGGITSEPGQSIELKSELTSDCPSVDLGSVSSLSGGCHSIQVTAEVDGMSFTRNLGATVLLSGTPLSGDWSQRQDTVLQLLSESDEFDPTVALCLAATKSQPERLVQIVDVALDTIEQRYDCSDFTLLPLLRIYRDFRDSLPESLGQRLEAAILGYRYWLDEPGNDVMWFWSENHVLCFHVAQYLAGSFLPDATFSCSGRLGTVQASIARQRLLRWFEAIERDGLCEWNSAAYYPIDMLGLLTLHEMAHEFRPQAARLLDQIFVMAALHSLGGVSAGSQGRCYEKELLAGPHTELGSAMAMALGGHYSTGYDRVAGLLAVSSYEPPPDLPQLASVPRGRSLQAAYVQGHGQAGQLMLWKSATAQLSTTRALAPGTEGHQTQFLDVQVVTHPMARLWINHPGDVKAWGERRPSLLAGSHVIPVVAQEGPYGFLCFDLQKDWTDLHYTNLFASTDALGMPQQAGVWKVFADIVAVWCSVDIEVENAGLYRGSLWRARGNCMAWCVALRLPDESIERFLQRLQTLQPKFDRQGLSLSNHSGDLLELALNGEFRKNGAPLPFVTQAVDPQICWDDTAGTG